MRVGFILGARIDRERAIKCIEGAPVNSRVEIKAPARTLDQNALMWALLTEISEQLVWQNQFYVPEDWKDFLMHNLRAGRWMPSEDGGFVPIGMRTSDLTKDEMSDLVEVIYAFGARHGVAFSQPSAPAQIARPSESERTPADLMGMGFADEEEPPKPKRGRPKKETPAPTPETFDETTGEILEDTNPTDGAASIETDNAPNVEHEPITQDSAEAAVLALAAETFGAIASDEQSQNGVVVVQIADPTAGGTKSYRPAFDAYMSDDEVKQKVAEKEDDRLPEGKSFAVLKRNAGPAPAGEVYILSRAYPDYEGKVATFKDGKPFSKVGAKGALLLQTYDDHPIAPAAAPESPAEPVREVEATSEPETAASPFAEFWTMLQAAPDWDETKKVIRALYNYPEFKELPLVDKARMRGEVWLEVEAKDLRVDVAYDPTAFRLWLDTQEGSEGVDAVVGNFRVLKAGDLYLAMHEDNQEALENAVQAALSRLRGA